MAAPPLSLSPSTSSTPSTFSILKLLNGLGGTIHGSFFGVPNHIDVDKPPGRTRISCPDTLGQAMREILSGRAFFYSPNLVWFLLALMVWWVAPYPYSDNINISNAPQQQHHHHHQQQYYISLWKERLVVNHILVLGYVGFWHLSLYFWHWGQRPFVSNRPYVWPKILHNVYYTWLGIVQWSVTEVAFCYLYQTHRLPYITHEEFSMARPMVLVQTLLACVWVSEFRNVHFYFSHRFIHTQFVYKYVHSLHHRNTDIEPFSGLCMHPIEHLYYYTCYGPCLIFRCHPFLVWWMGMHAMISPAASHSGYEDHFQSDILHYLHHKHTDCNYGVPYSIPLDKWFGSFRDHLKETTDTASYYKSNAQVKPTTVRNSSTNTNSNTTATTDPKARLGLWKLDHAIFNGSWMLLWFGVWQCRKDSTNPILPAWVGAILVTMGPLVIAWWISQTTLSSSSSSSSPWSPLDKDSLQSRVLHLGMGFLLGVLPATYLVYLVLL